MRLKKVAVVFLLSMLTLSLSGCKSVSVTSTEKKVEEYNKIVTDTMEAYSKSVANSKKSKEDIIKDLTKDTGISLNSRYDLIRLSDEDKKDFDNPMVNMDTYFTSVGASATREVILLVGTHSKVMSIVLVWSDNDLIDIERKIK